jgi:two-component system cell cycle sensor histidine kinase/response regulator CckA
MATMEFPAAVNKLELVHLLILKDDPHDVELIVSELRGAGILSRHTIARNKAEFRDALSKPNVDAILSDYHMPGWNGLEALKEVRARGCDAPFLLVTGAIGEEAAVECIKQGVSDYVLKDHISRLPLALQRALQERALRAEAARAQAALAESEVRVRQQFAELDLLYRTAPFYLAVVDRDLRFIRVNDTLARHHGLPQAAFVVRALDEIIPESAENAANLYRQVFATGKPILNREARVRRSVPPYEQRDYLSSFYPVSSKDEVQAACVVMVDITERKRAEEDLRRMELRNRDLVEHSIYGICRVSVDGAFQDANPALLRILGLQAAADLRDLNLMRDVFRYPEEFVKAVAACQQSGRLLIESEWQRDGVIAAVRLHLRFVSGESQPPSIEVIAEDVTELRAMERQLRQAQKFEAIGQLAGGIAHDFNNVVGAILGWAELGYEQNRSVPQAADRFTRIREQAERAAALTRELLAFARRQVLQPRAVDLNTVTSGLFSFLDRVLGKDIELKVVTAPLDAVKADPTQIEQVLMNLCLNARDAMPKGGRLLVETEMVEIDDAYWRSYPYASPGRYAVLSVSDTGTGMDSETRERIFEPFFTTKEKGKGTGMGLATVYGIVKQHNGFIHVYSELGHGSLFRVYLPIVEGGVVGEGAAFKTLAPTLEELHGTETILIAEDHESIREMARQTLAGAGYKVLCTSDGQEALQVCQREAPDIVILDVVMPKLGGSATAACLLERFAGLPILFTSGYSQDSEAIAAVPGSQYLQKPYSPTALARMVREMLDRRQSTKAT